MGMLGRGVLGSAETLPERVVPTAEVAALCGISAEEAVQRTGVKTRRRLSKEEDPLLQEVSAAQKAIQAAFCLDSGRAEHILIVSTEAGSRGLNFNQPDSALLIGDAAAAVVVGKPVNDDQGIVASEFSTDTHGIHDAEIRGVGSRLRVADAADHLDEVGNTIAAGIPLALHRAKMQQGETTLLVGTGSGTHYGALIVQW